MKPEITIHRLIRRLQQRNRFVGRSTENEFTLAEAHVLLELDTSPGRGVSELADHLRIDQSFASRLAQGLVRRRLVTVARESGDARKRKLSLTAAGRKVLRKLDDQANVNYRAMLSHISRGDEERIVWLLRTLSDGFGQPTLEVRSTETSYRTQQRRFTRCCGLLGDTVFGSKLSATMWQVLGEVVLSPVAPQPGELATLLSLAQNSLSSIVTTMEKRKLIKREKDDRDARSIVLRPLPAGERAYREVESLAAERIRVALEGAKADEVVKAIGAFQRFLGDSGEGVPPLPASCVVVRAESREERCSARGFIARSLVRESWEQYIPEHFVAPEHECLLIRSNGSLLAAIELDLSRGIIVSAGWDDSVSPWGLSSFIGEAMMRHPELRRPLYQTCESFEPLHAYVACRRIDRDPFKDVA